MIFSKTVRVKVALLAVEDGVVRMMFPAVIQHGSECPVVRAANAAFVFHFPGVMEHVTLQALRAEKLLAAFRTRNVFRHRFRLVFPQMVFEIASVPNYLFANVTGIKYVLLVGPYVSEPSDIVQRPEAAQITSEESAGIEMHHLLVILDRMKKLGAIVAILASISLLALVSEFMRAQVRIPAGFKVAGVAFERLLSRVHSQMLNQTQAGFALVIAAGTLVRLRAVNGHVILQRIDLVTLERAKRARKLLLDHFHRRHLFQFFSVFLNWFHNLLLSGWRRRVAIVLVDANEIFPGLPR